MKAKSFVDTNILIYAYSRTEPKKRTKALKVLAEADIIISTQVISEFIWVMHKKFTVPIEKIKILVFNLLQKFEVVLIDQSTVKKALDIAITYKYSYWDSLILASALENDCSICYSEDMQSGQIIEERLEILNPFLR